MSIKLGTVDIPDGAGMKLGTIQADKIMLGSEQVWVNNSPPSVITDFTASDDQFGTVTMNFTLATGIPAPTEHFLVENEVQLGSIDPGYVHTVSTGTYTYKVRASSIAGTTDSNEDSGTSAARPTGSQTFTSNGTWTVPAGVISATVCICGGGGAGATTGPYLPTGAGGGGSGSISSTQAVTGGEIVSVTIGAGAISYSFDGGASTAALASGTITAAGAGSANLWYAGAGVNGGGNGASYLDAKGGDSTGCGGSFTGGSSSSGNYLGGGGAGGFGVGANQSASGAANTGAGGGAKPYTPGAGGSGKCVITW